VDGDLGDLPGVVVRDQIDAVERFPAHLCLPDQDSWIVRDVLAVGDLPQHREEDVVELQHLLAPFEGNAEHGRVQHHIGMEVFGQQGQITRLHCSP
jgi:hypothetical protein